MVPVAMVPDTVLVAVLMTVMVLVEPLATYSLVPSGLAALPNGLLVVMVPVRVLVVVSRI